MEELKDVVLNVYTLAIPDGSAAGGAEQQRSSTASFFSRLLPSVGLGAYHTSLQVDGSTYTFTAGAGIVRQNLSRTGTGGVASCPPNAVFKEAIPLGSCRPKHRGEVAAIAKALEEFFGPLTAYHLVHRNCNHFTETFATALILHDELMEDYCCFAEATTNTNADNDSSSNSNIGNDGQQQQRPCRQRRHRSLATYPDWVNRLANTGAMVISHDADIVPCHVWNEAAKAIGAACDQTTRQLGWKNPSSNVKNRIASKKGKDSGGSAVQTKKTLTETQKKALEKIRKK